MPPTVAAPLSRSWSDPEAFAYCTALTKSHYENFPVGSWLMPAKLQPAVHSLYAFMRTADDFADENRSAGDETERLRYLSSWRQMLTECERGRAQHPIFIALQRTVAQYQLPVSWLRDLLHAFEMDATVRRYSTNDDLLEYCRYSANPVGRLILTLSGYRDERLYELSDAICTGLQLANHWQDVAVDLQKDRIYLPQEDMKRFGVADESLRTQRADDAYRRLLAFEVSRAREFFRKGQSLPEQVSGRLRWELRLTWHGGVRILDKIQALDFDTLTRRPVVGAWDWIGLAARSCAPCHG
ncbi:MAG TPA: squalene synthase HpnC [Elusimicrobiota bacterium]|nr:squalene synthase HpnC [Elusimicrobiota bacterium]